MAYINKDVSTMAMPSGMNRMGQFPLDMSSVYYDLDSLQNYATSGAIAYVGQVLSLVDEANNKVTVYSIQDKAGTLKEVGSLPLADNKSVIIDNTDGNKIKLHDFGKAYYEYVPEVKDEETGEVTSPATYRRVEVSTEKPWKAGLEPKVATENGELVIAWYEPNPTTIEGVNDQVTAVQGTVEDIEAEIGVPSAEGQEATGIYKEIEDVDTKVEELSDSVGTSEDALGDNVNTLWAHVNDHDSRLETLENKEDKDTTYTAAAADKVLKLSGTEFSTEISIKHENGRISLTGIDGAEIAGFDTAAFTKDSFLVNAEYDANTKELVFTWNTESGIQEDRVAVGSLVDTYTAAGATGTTVKVTATTTDNVHNVSAEVIEGSLKNVHIAADAAIEQGKISGLTEALDNKLEADDLAPYAKSADISESLAKADSAVQPAALNAYVTNDSLTTTLEGYATDGELKATDDVAKDAQSRVGIVEGKIDEITSVGGEPNVLERIKVNGVTVPIETDAEGKSTKSVNITVPTKFSDLTDDSGFDNRITTAQNRADEGVTKAGEANTAAANAQSTANEAVGKANANATAIENLQKQDTTHTTDINALKGVVGDSEAGLVHDVASHATLISQLDSGKASTTITDGLAGRITANENALQTLNETTIPGINGEIAKKANAADVYTKEQVGAIAEGKTLVQMINEAKSEATYDDTAIKALIQGNTDAISTLNGADAGKSVRTIAGEEVAKVIDSAPEAYDTLKEIADWITNDTTGAAAMSAAIAANTAAIGVKAEGEAAATGLYKYTDDSIAALQASIHGVDDDTIKLNENKAYVAKVSTDILAQGTNELVLSAGNASGYAV